MRIAGVIIALIALIATGLLFAGYENVKNRAAKLEKESVNHQQEIVSLESQLEQAREDLRAQRTELESKLEEVRESFATHVSELEVQVEQAREEYLALGTKLESQIEGLRNNEVPLAVGLTTQETGALIEVRGLWAIDGDTILVEFEGRREKVRYASVNALKHDAPCLGEETRLANDQLIKGEALWLDLDFQDGKYRRDLYQRLLAHVFLAPVQTPSASVSVLLVAQGLARLDVRDPHDREILEGKDFDVRYADWIVEAQVKAARARVGWWGVCDSYRDSDLVIAAIKQWTDETVYIVNRGTEPIDLEEGWSLADPKRQLIFAEFLPSACLLPPGGVLRVHSGPVCTGRKGDHTLCNESVIDWCWIGNCVWDKSGDEAWLRKSDAGEESQTIYYYLYPLNDWD
jgi:endonuclease YncB( thermonuclease family)/outer membrane murein-binding lipoprotein Lpp